MQRGIGLVLRRFAQLAGDYIVVAAVRDIVGSKPAGDWARIFAEVDCCCSIVRSLAEAVESPHFRARGVFDYRLRQGTRDDLGALPVPVAPGFRRPSSEPRDTVLSS